MDKNIKFLIIVAILGTIFDGTANQIISFDPNIGEIDLEEEIINKRPMKTCTNDEVVNLSGFGLKEIPREVVKSSTINTISLENNDLTMVPKEAFDETPNLQCLNLAGNRISIEALELEHKNLKTLILDHQKLPESDTMSSDCVTLNQLERRFPNLEHLSFKGVDHDCFYVSYASLASFPSLTSIDLSESNMAGLFANDSLSQFSPRLRILHLERNNIERLSLTYLANVEELYLDDNPLRVFRIDSANQNLKVLSLSGCSYGGPIELHSELLVSLDLSRNRIRYITNEMFRYTPSLENLNLSGNELSTFPVLSNLINLKKLSLARNFIDRVTSAIVPSSLQTLSLRKNRISVIDKMAFSNLAFLEELDLSHNELQSLHPNWHEGMHTLRYLNLRWNKFLRISDMWIGSLSSLADLYIKGNYVNKIDANELRIVPDKCVVHVT